MPATLVDATFRAIADAGSIPAVSTSLVRRFSFQVASWSVFRRSRAAFGVVGGGLELALSADLRLASPDTRFSIPAARLGLVYSAEGARLLVDELGAAVAQYERVQEIAGRILSYADLLRAGNVADVEIGRLSTTLCHLGNIAQRLGREVKFDPDTETFGKDEAANAMLVKQYRASYPLPKV